KYPRGRYPDVRQKYVAVRIDYDTRRVVLYDRSTWVVAYYDVQRCRDWAWDRDEVYVYDDDHHPGCTCFSMRAWGATSTWNTSADARLASARKGSQQARSLRRRSCWSPKRSAE